MRKTEFPSSVPVFEIISTRKPWFLSEADWILKNDAYENFVQKAPNRKLIIAEGSGHYIFLDNPLLVINTINKAYVETLKDPLEKKTILNNALRMSIEFLSKPNSNSEFSFNTLCDLTSYLLDTGEVEKALKLGKLNVELFPNESISYLCYGQALMLPGNNQEAKLMLEKTIELDPDNAIAPSHLKRLQDN